MNRPTRLPLLFIALILSTLCARATSAPPQPMVATSDIILTLNGLQPQPRLAVIVGHPHIELANRAEEPLPTFAEINGATVPLTWQHKAELDTQQYPHLAVLVYESAQPHLRLTWEWEARAAHGPIEHRITVENLGDKEVWLPMVDSLRLDIRVHPGEDTRLFYVEKGADKPSPQGTHLDTISEDYRWTGTSSTYAHPTKTSPAKSFPPSSSSTTRSRSRAGTPASNSAAAPASPSSAPTPASTLSSDSTRNPVPSARASPPAPPSKHPPSSSARSAAAPTAPPTNCVPGFAPFSAIPSPGGSALPYVVNNSWGSGMAVDEPLALRMISESKELGVEMFHIDAGWFRGVGDWYPDPKKFPHGLAPIADEAHKQGLRFGIWVDWTQAALDSPNRARSTSAIPKSPTGWSPTSPPDWKPEEFKGQTIDLGVPAAHDYLLREVNASSKTTTSTCSSTTATSSPRAAPATTTPTPRPIAAP